MTRGSKNDQQGPITDSAHAALIALAKLLGRAAAREQLRAIAQRAEKQVGLAGQSRGSNSQETSDD